MRLLEIHENLVIHVRNRLFPLYFTHVRSLHENVQFEAHQNTLTAANQLTDELARVIQRVLRLQGRTLQGRLL